jgi:hypothetical protein
MRFILSCFILITISIHAQIKPEITEVKRIMSLGEKAGYKLTILNQDADKVEKITKEVLKTISAEQVKMPKSNRELVFRKLYLQKEDKPIYLFADIVQEGKDIGWTGYFLFEKDSSICTNSKSIKLILAAIHSKIIYTTYEDSVYFQQKIIKEANSNLADKTKESEKNQKRVNEAKDDIHNAELAIEKSNADIIKVNETISGLEKIVKEKKIELKTAEDNLDKVKKTEDAIDDTKSKLKKMTKNLTNLQKEPAINENLIIAQQQDITSISLSIAEQEAAFKLAKEKAKSEVKIADKISSTANDNLKNAKKSIDNNTDNISDSNKKIEKLKSKMNELYAQIDTFMSKDKSRLEYEIKKQESILIELKNTQSLYK